MSKLVIKRIWRNEAITVLTATMRIHDALAYYNALGSREPKSGPAQHGDVWIEIENQAGDTLTDPLQFPIFTARDVLAEVCGASDILTQALTDEEAMAAYMDTRYTPRKEADRG